MKESFIEHRNEAEWPEAIATALQANQQSNLPNDTHHKIILTYSCEFLKPICFMRELFN